MSKTPSAEFFQYPVHMVRAFRHDRFLVFRKLLKELFVFASCHSWSSSSSTARLEEAQHDFGSVQEGR